MKKTVSRILAVTLAMSSLSLFGASDKAEAITYILDEQTRIKETREHCWDPLTEGYKKDTEKAMKLNAENFSKLMETVEVTNDTTSEDLMQWMYDASEYSGLSGEGPTFRIHSFELTKATTTQEGSLKAEVGYFQFITEERVSVECVIPKLPAGTPEEKELTLNQDLGADFDYKTEFQNANTAIHRAMESFAVSNNTTADDIVQMAQAALPQGSKITVVIEDKNFSLLKATTTVNGTLSATLTLICGTQTKKIPVAKTVEPTVTDLSKKIDADRKAVNLAIDKLSFGNQTTKEDVLAAVLPEVTNGTEVSWEAFSVQKATFDEEGVINASLLFRLGDEERKTEFSRKLQKLVRKIPTDKLSVNANEWEVLRLTNNARAAAGASALSMTDVLQQTADIREAELLELYSHTRPNGQTCFTALPSNYPYKTLAENIAQCVGRKTVPYSPAEATRGWINSSGHYANMINTKYSYVGMGFLSIPDRVECVQMFSNGSAIETVETSAGTFCFENTDELQKEYLICTTADGTPSYLPLDIEQMEKTDNGYKLNLNGKSVVFTVTEGKVPIQTAVAGFDDVSGDAYYASAVEWAVQNGVTAGTAEHSFSPDDPCTRAQILTFMWRAFGSPEPTVANPFRDVQSTDYYYKPALWAYERGMVSDGKFAPATPCRRSDTMKYFWLYAGSPLATTAAFSDVTIQRDYFDAVNWAVSVGITGGTSATTFSPDLICSRAQIVTFLLRAVNALQ